MFHVNDGKCTVQLSAVQLEFEVPALELLLYPSSLDLILDKALALAGTARVKPARVPIVLLVWGPLRVLPVRVESKTDAF